jgi:elongation factor Ts
VSKGTDAVAELSDRIDELKVAKRENIELGQITRFEAGEGNIVDSYLHLQDGRGVNAVLVELKGGDKQLAHDLAVHIAFTKPPYLTRDEVPEDEVATERANLESLTRAEGKPEQALPKIVEGRLGAWFKDRVLLEQSYVKDEKRSITDLLGDAELVRFAQAYIGA